MAVAVVVNSPNWPKVRDQFFNPSEFREAWPDVLRGFWVDVQMFAYGLVAIPIVALVLATARSFRGPAFFPLRVLAIVFIDVIRGIPLILLILLLGFGVPALEICRAPDERHVLGHHGADHVLRRLHRRDHPLGHRGGAREPAGLGPGHRPHPVAGPALRHPPAGHPQRRSPPS